jgi:hypothetical protein
LQDICTAHRRRETPSEDFDVGTIIQIRGLEMSTFHSGSLRGVGGGTPRGVCRVTVRVCAGDNKHVQGILLWASHFLDHAASTSMHLAGK